MAWRDLQNEVDDVRGLTLNQYEVRDVLIWWASLHSFEYVLNKLQC